MSIDKDLLDRPMEGSSSPGASFGKEGVPAHLTKALAEPALRVEPTEHLDEERAEALPTWRNGSSPKTVATDSGKMLPDRPRDRNGNFDPIPIAKDRRRLPEVDPRIVSLYARGMTSRESQGQIEAIHGIEGIEASPHPISAIADAGMDAVTAWRNQPLEPMLSGRLHGRDPGRYSQVWNTAGFSDLAILPDGTGDVLGLRFQANEGATVRAKGLNASRNRGV